MTERIIRPMTGADMDAVLAVEGQCHRHPWSRQLFADELANPRSAIDLLRMNETLAGFHCYWRVGDEMDILNVAVAPAFRRQGVARFLLSSAIEKERQKGLERVLLEVRVQNEAAIGLYRSLGFADVGTRRGYYHDGEDALVMELAGGALADFCGTIQGYNTRCKSATDKDG